MSFFEILTLTGSLSEKYVFNTAISLSQSSKYDFFTNTWSNIVPAMYVENPTNSTYSDKICGNLVLLMHQY